MKILQIARQFSPSVGGIENVTLGLTKALAAAGHRSDVVTLRSIFSTGETAPPESSIDGFHVYRLPHMGSKRYPLAPAIDPFIPHYDLVHIHAIDFFVDFLSLMRRRHCKPIVVNTHGGIFHTRWFTPLKKLYFALATRASLRRVDAVICDSDHDYAMFRRIVPQYKLHIIPNGVDTTSFLSIRKQITPGLLVGIGRIVENKRVEHLIEALAIVAQTYSSARLVWIGHDPQGRVLHLNALAAQHGIADRVQFTGEIDIEAMQEILGKAHLFVSASAYEAFGVSTIEAMSSATVPIVTPVGIHPEVIIDGQTGWLCGFEADHIAACLQRALSCSMDELAGIGQQAQQVAQRYAWERTVQRYLDVYRQVM